MNQTKITNRPPNHAIIEAKAKETGFTMPSDIYIGTLLKTLIASKPQSNILELGTGASLSLSWMVDGLDTDSRLTSIDNDPALIQMASEFFRNDPRITLICRDGSEWIQNYEGEGFDLIFADAWPGKYSETEEILALVKPGGFYVIDDMMPQPNWPEGHQDNVDRLITYLESRQDFTLTKMEWSTGVILMTKKA
ncbi:MAG: class I SAM-dependent methyltransferase [Bacteroidetes bacterium]|nr:class I SAM-dependent methyltransferase [Bacteroidota bacterium]MCB0845195.1 class I SAM-dependent methyltransferase [Bacteroidota bacterium]